MSMIQEVPPYPADGGIVKQAGWILNYGMIMIMYTILFLAIAGVRRVKMALVGDEKA